MSDIIIANEAEIEAALSLLHSADKSSRSGFFPFFRPN